MLLRTTRPREAVADAISRIVVGPAWSGSIAALFAAIDAAAHEVERGARSWPASASALATCLRGQSDALWGHGLRLTIMPDDVLLERHPVTRMDPRPTC